MSLLDRGPPTVRVTPATVTDGAVGPVVTHDPANAVTVSRVSIQPMSTEESGGVSTITTARYKVFGRGEWPGGPLSRVEVIKGPALGSFSQDGPTRYHTMSRRTEHYQVYLTENEGTDR